MRTVGPRELLAGFLPLFRNPAAALFDLASGASEFTEIQTPTFRFVQVNDPLIARRLLSRHSDSLAKGPFFARNRDLLGNGILSSDEPLHGQRRRDMLPFFSGARMDGYAAALQAVVNESIDAWLAVGDIDLGEQMRDLTLAAVLRCFFGSPKTQGSLNFLNVFASELDSYTATKLLTDVALSSPRPTDSPRWQILDKAAAVAIQALLQAYSLKTSARSGVRERMRAYPDALIADRIKELDKELQGASALNTDDLLSALCKLLRVVPSQGWSQSAVRDELLTVLLAGHETTASSLTWSLMLLGADSKFTSGGDQAIDQVIYETLRLYPPAWVIPRVVTRSFEVERMKLSAGTHLIVSPYLYHRQSVFNRPHEFRPDRWTDELMATPPVGFMPFGVGDRACIGQRFAWLEMRTVLSSVLDRTRLALLTPVPEPNFLFTLRPSENVKLRVVAA